jgi:hypothetical protein
MTTDFEVVELPFLRYVGKVPYRVLGVDNLSRGELTMLILKL